MSDKQKQKRGFTLIELLVVIAIIGNLSVIAIVNLNDARALARDAVRMHDFDTFSKGLELYYSTHGVYPCGNGGYTDSLSGIDATVDSTHSCENLPTQPGVNGFLNGPGPTIPAECYGESGQFGGLFEEGILYTNCPKDPKNTDNQPNQINYGYWLNVSGDRQSYSLTTYLERNTNKRRNDGGGCTGYYEVLGGAKEITMAGFPSVNIRLGPNISPPFWTCTSP